MLHDRSLMVLIPTTSSSMPLDLKGGDFLCSSAVETRLLRFWEARNVKLGDEFMLVDILMVDVNRLTRDKTRPQPPQLHQKMGPEEAGEEQGPRFPTVKLRKRCEGGRGGERVER
ncbi:Uncharacterized protein Rs2_10286 [Raphanus sativus]|nr:Uncharacterized protein Rs2_10286 [Raphanus sativus]